MDVTKPSNDEIRNELRQAQIQDHTTCCLCGTELKFNHKPDYARLRLIEQAHCPACRIQLKSREHIVH